MKQKSFKNKASITFMLSHLILMGYSLGEMNKSDNSVQNGSNSVLNQEKPENGSTSAL